jgi:hypothetical protein
MSEMPGKHFSNTKIVADRFHVLLEQTTRLEAYFDQFPVLRESIAFKQRLCYLLLKKHRTRKPCAHLAHRFLKAQHELSQAGLVQLVQRKSPPRGISPGTTGIEGFYIEMEVLQRQAYGFRNFNNYRLRVKILCS